MPFPKETLEPDVEVLVVGVRGDGAVRRLDLDVLVASAAHLAPSAALFSMSLHLSAITATDPPPPANLFEFV